MRRFLLPLLALGLVGAAAPHPAVRAKGQVHDLVSEADYPAEALRKNEQGKVGFRVDISPAGAVTGCTVTASSGSAALDRETCRLVRERARFTAARDRRGRAVADTWSSTIDWRVSTLPAAPAEFQASADIWMTCLRDAVAPRLASADTAQAITQKAFDACTAEERALAAVGARILPSSAPAGSEAMRSGMRAEMIRQIVAAWAQTPANR